MSHPHQREVAVFETALQLPPEQREAYLHQTCAGDPDLLQRIQALLKADESQTDFLAPAASAVQPSLPPTEKPGDRIGPYKLLQQIGEGGCGVVYMAEQEQPIRRRVALKIIKLGMDTKQVIARFEAERQALALMDHPNIAKVHDAGATETGRPYFVMELVRGIKITDYCDENKLPTRQQLELFIQVCQAVQHAHQKGIIHRDLKPSNILVTINDGVAVVKVIDFGIAKATSGERLTDKTIFTAFEQFIGTPAYMSPEQAAMTSLDIDTRSDIYSLGVLLYELLTGKTPFDTKELLQVGLDEMRRTICEKEPARPSTRLGTLSGDELTTTAQRRSTDPPKLLHLVRGDLDWIAMKCLEKDRARRYETANGLAMDIQRYLNQEPVIARPPSRLYEFQKTVRRHWVGFAATAAVIASLLVGLIFSTILHFRETQAKKEAIRQTGLARAAEAKATEELRNSLVAQAKAVRLSNRAGRRFESLELLRKAAAIRPSLELRNEAIAAMALTDLRKGRELNFSSFNSQTDSAFDADYDSYAVAHKDGTITLHRLLDDKEVWSFPGYETPIWDLKLSPDGRLLFIVFGPKHDRIEVRDLLDSRIAMSLSGQNYRAAEFSADSRLLVISWESEANRWPIQVFAVANGELLSSFAHGSLPWSVTFNPIQPDWLLSSDTSELVRLWNWKNGSVVRTLLHPGGVFGICWSPDGTSAATACADSKVRIWEIPTGRVCAEFSGHESDVTVVTFSGDGMLLASRGWDGRMCLWDVAGKREVARMAAPSVICSFSHTGRQLGIWTGPGKATIMDAMDGCGYRVLRSAIGDDPPLNCDFSLDGRFLLSANRRSLSLWDTVSGTNLLRCPCAEDERFGLFHSNGTKLFVGAADGIEEWTLTNSPSVTQAGLSRLHKTTIGDRWHHLTFGDDHRTMAFISRGTVRVQNTDFGEAIMQTSARGYELSSLSMDGRLVAAWRVNYSNDPTPIPHPQVDVWDVATTNLLKSLPCSLSAFAAFSPNSHSLAIGDDTEFRLWDVHTWKPIYTVPREYSGFWGYLAFSPDGKMLAVAISRSMVQVRDAATGRELAALEAPEQSQITWITFSPGGDKLAVVCSAPAIQLWDLRAIRQQLASMKLDWKLPADSPSTIVNPAPSAALPSGKL